jgi:hypothetical protein
MFRAVFKVGLPLSSPVLLNDITITAIQVAGGMRYEAFKKSFHSKNL